MKTIGNMVSLVFSKRQSKLIQDAFHELPHNTKMLLWNRLIDHQTIKQVSLRMRLNWDEANQLIDSAIHELKNKYNALERSGRYANKQ
ncbi:hypothetical protein K2X05_11650 [bacterium]|nr:hypothetical protein [bacterium]